MLDSNEICLKWLEEKKLSLKTLSYDKYENAVNKYLLSFFVAHPMEELDKDIIEQYLIQLQQSGLSYSSAKFLKSALKSIYIYAERTYHLNHIDFACVEIGQKSETNHIILNAQQEETIFKYCCENQDALSIAVLLCLYAGLRFSEICVLKYSDIHLDEHYIDITKMVQRCANREDSLTKTKYYITELTGVNNRQVIITDFLCDLLESFMVDYNDNKYLLSRDYRLPEQRSFQNKLKKLGKLLGFDVTFLTLRNTFKENCIKNNVDTKILINMLGIRNLVLTNDDDYRDEMSYKRSQLAKIQPDI